ncbi:MDR family MFS transporter [Paenibacillus macquariensis]|uniref:Drug resistance transporter, EmrB/QacA subfamily n=1 Tax=Paenibacillus macquariensis TaxID=948756 RepID=A0ABY1K4V6_9BACL|nr:MDR family MFS transporter [Paenibacillus macquariensis]MEC0089083.1 MDR family MFS transporter [Paenibacillus macquariensis]OAB31795.1 MFS transporter [Paenibacillus macquariensis subsp. macquariensis]SIR25801.1 drug resistance transporter, EmrB/QacA subfamily [Paenibacillus macquariensis]
MALQTAASAPVNTEFSIKTIIAPLMAVILGMIMVILDSTVINVAIPNLQAYFGTELKTIQWTITGYMLALSAVIPLAGWMTDKFGAKKIFVITIALFTFGSILCSLAQTSEQLIIFRVIQGLGGGMVAPIGMAMVFKLAPPDKRGSVMGMLGIPMLLAPASGPILSGWLIDIASWHWIFIINVPIGIVAVIVGIKFLPSFESKKVPSLDIFGIILAPIAFAMLAYGVSEAGTSWTSRSTLTGLIVGGVALILFIIVELKQKEPLLELRVFASSDFTRGVILSWITQVAMFGAILMIPLYLQNVRGFTPLESGFTTLAQALASMVLMPFGGKMFDKWGARPLLLAGLTLVSTALFLFSQITVDTAMSMIILPLVFMGAGMGLTMMPLNTHILNSAPRKLVNRVTPLTSATQQVVTSFAIAGLTGYLTSQIVHYMSAPETAGNMQASSTAAFADTFFITACVAVAGLVLTIFLRKPRVNPGDELADDEMPDVKTMISH